MQDKLKILFVCTGNICRSPTAEAVMRHHAPNFDVDSAGIQSFHVGEAPDSRTQDAALNRGYDMSQQRARKVSQQDFHEFDYILAMDKSHLEWLKQNCPNDAKAQVDLFIDGDVPDPYYGAEQGFEHVLDIVEMGVNEWLANLNKN